MSPDLLDQLLDTAAVVSRRCARSAASTHRARPRACVDHATQCVPERVAIGTIVLVEHEHIGDLEEPGLGGLDLVARFGRDDDERRVGDSRDVELTLANADRLDQHVVIARGLEHVRTVRDCGAQAAERATRRHAADEDASVGGDVVHAYAVAEHGAARERTRWIDGDHGNGAGRAQRPDELHRERRFACAGRARDADADRTTRGAQLRQQRCAASPPRSTSVSARATAARSRRSSASGASAMVVSPFIARAASVRNSRLSILPLGFFGSSSRKTIRLGSLKLASWCRQCATSSSAVAAPPT